MSNTKEITCCFTGHRELPSDIESLSNKLEQALLALLAKGYRQFCAGGALGFDTLAALKVLELKNRFPELKLALVLPCENQSKYWNEKDASLYQSLLEQADSVVYTAKQYYRGCMHKRNRRLVDDSSFCICYLQKKTGGTKFTVDYCQKQGVPIQNLAG